MDVLIATLEGIPAALVATVITVFAVHLVQPKIKISDCIAVAWSEELDQLRVGFKVQNKTRRSIVDLKFELTIMYPNGDGRMKNSPVVRDRPEPLSIAAAAPRKHQYGTYVITYQENLIDEIIRRERPGEGRCKLRLRIFGRDAVSGKGKQFQMYYKPLFENALVYGAFEAGPSLEVKESPTPNERWSEKLSAAKDVLAGTVPINEVASPLLRDDLQVES